MTQALHTKAFCAVQVSGAARVKKTAALAVLPLPQRISDLREKDYRIAVHADSMSHHLAISELGIPAERLIVCERPEETIERIILTGIPRPAHLILTHAPHAAQICKESPEQTTQIFTAPDPEAPPYEDTIALRPYWPSVASLLNDSLEFLRRNGSLTRLLQRTIDAPSTPGIMIAT